MSNRLVTKKQIIQMKQQMSNRRSLSHRNKKEHESPNQIPNRCFGSVISPKLEQDEEDDLPGRSRSRDSGRKVLHAPARGTEAAASGGTWTARAAAPGGRNCRLR